MKPMIGFLLVGLGGAIGALLRYGCCLVFGPHSCSMPYATLIANCAGCLCIGIVAGLGAYSAGLSLETRLFIATGICGGFTTLSTLMYELAEMGAQGRYGMAALYFGATFGGSAAAFGAGMMLTRIVVRM